MAERGLRSSDEFNIIGPNSSISHACTSAPSSNDEEPCLVIICSWMGASSKNIKKYAAGYRKLAPNAVILLVQSAIWDMTWRSAAVQEKNLLQALEVVERFSKSASSASSISTSRPKAILHIFSHGGSNSAIRLLRGVQARKNIPTPIPFTSFVLDSTPGDDDYHRAIAAVAAGLQKSGPARWIGLALAHLTLIGLTTLGYLGLTKRVKDLRKELINPNTFEKSTPRLYCFSKADAMVDWKQVQLHAEEAEAEGYHVDTRCFKSSPHCGHLLEDERGYWDAVGTISMIG